MCTEQPKESCLTGCRPIEVERNRYFTGKYMTARDFRGEQEYFLSHHRLHNRLFHGWGIVCGLEVVPHGVPECQDRWVVVCPGIAIDCCGRELILDKKMPIKVWQPPELEPAEEEAEPDKDAQSGGDPYAQSGLAKQFVGDTAQQTAPQQQTTMDPSNGNGDEDDDEDGYLLYLHYVEEKIEHVPALYAEGTCDPTRQEANRVREVAHLEVRRFKDIRNSGWRDDKDNEETWCRDDCADPLPGPQGACLVPECPCKEMVPLALITPRATTDKNKPQYVIGEDEIDTNGRRQLPLPAEFLTHIRRTSWPHGGEISVSDLQDQGGRLEIWFDRKLRPAEPDEDEPWDGQTVLKGQRSGINKHTFVVQYVGVQDDLEFVRRECPPALENDCRAVFTIEKRSLAAMRGYRIYVTLRCDFILDCHGNPVDGNHLGGRLPSGNGTRGGVFESWFRITD